MVSLPNYMVSPVEPWHPEARRNYTRFTRHSDSEGGRGKLLAFFQGGGPSSIATIEQ